MSTLVVTSIALASADVVVGEGSVVEESPGTAKAVAKLPVSIADGTASTVSAAAVRIFTVSPNPDDRTSVTIGPARRGVVSNALLELPGPAGHKTGL